MSSEAYRKYLVPQLGEQHLVTKIDGKVPVWDVLQKIDDVLVYKILQSIEINHLNLLDNVQGEQLIKNFAEVMDESQRYLAGGIFRHECNGWIGDFCRGYAQTRDIEKEMLKWNLNEDDANSPLAYRLISNLHQNHEDKMITAGLNSIGNLVMNGCRWELDKIDPRYARESLVHVAAWQNNSGNHPGCVLDTLDRLNGMEPYKGIQEFREYLMERQSRKD